MLDVPFVDWNGNEEIDTSDISISLAMSDSEDNDED